MHINIAKVTNGYIVYLFPIGEQSVYRTREELEEAMTGILNVLDRTPEIPPVRDELDGVGKSLVWLH